MKKKIVHICLITVIMVITAFFIHYNKVDITKEKEERGIFISYIEYTKYFDNKNKDEIKLEIKNMISNIKEYGFNFIILQVRPFSDAIYYSNIFPSSWTVVSEEGKELPLDILDYFIKVAHQNDIKLHAWINPYRISNDTNTSKISKKNPAYSWLGTNHVKVIEDKGIYYNPASKKVEDLIISGVEEIVTNYDVDGIHMDDYFYPNDTIDLENYEEFKNTISLTDYRLSNTNHLIKSIYQKIKKIKPQVLFGISPDGNIENNYNNHYADVKTWVQKEGYIDYIMPQIYYGFFNESKPFIQTLNEWKNLIKTDIKLIPALALYKVGTIDEYAMSGKNEWLEHNNIISNQIKILRNKNKIYGYSLFRYDYLINGDNEFLKLEQKSIKKLNNR